MTFGPYSPVRYAGNTYYISGQIGVEPGTKHAAADIQAQTHQALANMSILLREQGLSLNDVVKTTVFLTDMSNFQLMNEIYTTYFTAEPPARSCVAVRELPRVSYKPLLVEIEAVAYKQSDPREPSDA